MGNAVGLGVSAAFVTGVLALSGLLSRRGASAEATRKRFDKKRANYYSANTTKKWDNAANYDIVLDSGMLGTDGCVSALKGFLI